MGADLIRLALGLRCTIRQELSSTFEGFDNPAQVLEEGGMVNKTTGNITVNNQLRWKVIERIYELVGKP